MTPEEYFRKWSENCRIFENYKPIHSHEDMMRFARDYHIEQLRLHVVISRLLKLKRYEASTGAGWEGSGAVWTELDEEKDGDLVKFEDVQRIIDELNGL